MNKPMGNQPSSPNHTDNNEEIIDTNRCLLTEETICDSDITVSLQGIGTMTYPNGIRYEGAWSNGMRHGQGKLFEGDKEIYSGEWQNDIIDGNGTIVLETYVYTGEFVHGAKNGHGIATNKDGQIFDGVWKNNTPVKGTWTYGHGHSYTGEYRQEGQVTYGTLIQDRTGETSTTRYQGTWLGFGKHGKGRYNDGTKSYDGEWKSDKMDGRGKMEIDGIVIYDGEWKSGKSHGYGKWYGSLDKSYTGEFIEGRFHGSGKYSSPTISYDGEWKLGLRSGYGTQIDESGTEIIGQWNEDTIKDGTIRNLGLGITYVGQIVDLKPDGTGKMISDDGSYWYQGMWSGGKFHGIGELKTQSGLLITGEFKNGSPIGIVGCIYPDGSTYRGKLVGEIRQGTGILVSGSEIYDGEWFDNKRSGNGKLYHNDHCIYNGSWSNDEYSGPGTFTDNSGKIYTGNWDGLKGTGRVTMSDGSVYEGEFTIECDRLTD